MKSKAERIVESIVRKILQRSSSRKKNINESNNRYLTAYALLTNRYSVDHGERVIDIISDHHNALAEFYDILQNNQVVVEISVDVDRGWTESDFEEYLDNNEYLQWWTYDEGVLESKIDKINQQF